MVSFDIKDWPNRVCFGLDKVGVLPRLVADTGGRRALVVCGKTVAGGEMLARVRTALGPACAAVFPGVEHHTTLGSVWAGVEVARDHQVDVVISVGGGSAIDTAKCIVMMLACGGDWEPYSINYKERGMERASLQERVLPHIAVPTTAGSASDIMPSTGCRDPETRTKLLFWDDALRPRVTVMDPRMAVFAGPELTAATGMTAVARCVEALYSGYRQPISTGLALHGLRLLRKGLPRTVENPDDLEARGACQIACINSGVAAINALASVVHAIGHILGGQYGLPHGVPHALLLAPALRRLLPEIGEDGAWIGEALGVETEGANASDIADAAAAAMNRLVGSLPLPQRLRDTNIAEADLPQIAADSLNDYLMPHTPVPLTQADVLGLLKEAW